MPGYPVLFLRQLNKTQYKRYCRLSAIAVTAVLRRLDQAFTDFKVVAFEVCVLLRMQPLNWDTATV